MGEQQQAGAERRTSRRSFVVGSLVAGAGAATGGILGDGLATVAHADDGALSAGDAAILRFLSAAEILETDLWQQYNELGGIQDSQVPGGSGSPAYTAALSKLDADMSQYIHDNTQDEHSHFRFLNAYLRAHGASGVNLDRFRTLPSSKATGAQQIGRLTNLMELTVDTTWYTRYRSHTKNPDLGGSFPEAVPGSRGRHVPRHPTLGFRPRAPEAPAGDREHRRLPFCLHRAGRHEPLRLSPRGSPAARCSGSCSASAAPGSCTSRHGTTRRATRVR